MKISALVGVAGLAAVALSAPAFAALPANDNAEDAAAYVTPNSWAFGSNGGSGWAPWNIQNNNGAAPFTGSFLANNAGNGDLDDVDTPPHAWGSYANGTGVQKFAAYRQLTGDGLFVSQNLVNGQSITIYHENGDIQGGGYAGVHFGPTAVGSLDPFAGGTVGALNGQASFGFFGGDNNYKIVDALGTLDTGIPWSNRGFAVTFTLINQNTGQYTMSITRLSDSANFVFPNRQVNGGIFGIGLFNYDTEFGNVYWNSVSIVPTPGSAALLGLAGLCGLRRRRQA